MSVEFLPSQQTQPTKLNSGVSLEFANGPQKTKLNVSGGEVIGRRVTASADASSAKITNLLKVITNKAESSPPPADETRWQGERAAVMHGAFSNTLPPYALKV